MYDHVQRIVQKEDKSFIHNIHNEYGLLSSGTYKHGRLNGPAVDCFQDGSRVLSNFKDNRPYGRHLILNPDGKPTEEFYRAGSYDYQGLRLEYDDEGVIKRQSLYIEDREIATGPELKSTAQAYYDAAKTVVDYFANPENARIGQKLPREDNSLPLVVSDRDGGHHYMNLRNNTLPDGINYYYKDNGELYGTAMAKNDRLNGLSVDYRYKDGKNVPTGLAHYVDDKMQGINVECYDAEAGIVTRIDFYFDNKRLISGPSVEKVAQAYMEAAKTVLDFFEEHEAKAATKPAATNNNALSL